MTNRQTDINGFVEIKNNPISKVGVFPYLGAMIDSTLDPDKIYYVYRPAEELGAAECIDSFKLQPFIDEHVMLGVEDNEDFDIVAPEKKGIHGVTGENVYFDPEDRKLKANLRIFSKTLLKKIDNGKKELSLGYRAEYDLTPGVFEGHAYDAIQRNLRGNHTALVKEGRSGPDIAVLDHFKFTFDTAELLKMEEKTMQDADPMQQLLAKIEALEAKFAAMEVKRSEMGETTEEPILDETAVEAEKKEDAEPIKDEAEKKEDDKKSEDAAGDFKKPGAMDSRDAIVKALLREIKDKTELANSIAKAGVGVFDHADKTLSEVVKYGMDKLNLSAPKGQEYAMLSGFLKAHNKFSNTSSVMHRPAMDMLNTTQSSLDRYIKECS